MEIVKTIDAVVYPSPSWWNPSINPEAKITDCLPNCTMFVYGALKQSGIPVCCDVITDARNFHKHLKNGWMCVPYAEYKANIKIGDVMEWEEGNHVAIVSNIVDGVPWISGSFYTGEHGKAYADGGYDTRNSFTSLKQVNDFMLANYQYRYFHHVPLEEENKWCGGEPDYVLVSPMSIMPVDKDTTKNQIYVGITGLRVRTEPNTDAPIRGVANVGYYTIDEVIEGGDFGEGNIWYKIGDMYVANVGGVQYYPKDNTIPIDAMMSLMEQMKEAYTKVCLERDEYKAMLDKIRSIANVD